MFKTFYLKIKLNFLFYRGKIGSSFALVEEAQLFLKNNKETVPVTSIRVSSAFNGDNNIR